LNNKIRDLTKQCSGQADTINELWGSTCDESIKTKKMQKERDEVKIYMKDNKPKYEIDFLNEFFCFLKTLTKISTPLNPYLI
jgi:hypothetical protein